VANGISTTMQILACAVPIYALHWVIEPIAGRTTKFEANVVISLAFTASIVVNAGLALKGRWQRAEIKRMRQRLESLEQEELG
jgi:hypothetical protein